MNHDFFAYWCCGRRFLVDVLRVRYHRGEIHPRAGLRGRPKLGPLASPGSRATLTPLNRFHRIIVRRFVRSRQHGCHHVGVLRLRSACEPDGIPRGRHGVLLVGHAVGRTYRRHVSGARDIVACWVGGGRPSHCCGRHHTSLVLLGRVEYIAARPGQQPRRPAVPHIGSWGSRSWLGREVPRCRGMRRTWRAVRNPV